MDVRAPNPDDISALHRLIGQLGYAVPDSELAERVCVVASLDHHLVRVAEIEGQVVGFVHVFERPSLEKGGEAIVQAIAVDGALRRAGIGARLMREAETWAARRGLNSIALHTRVDREDAHAFYARNGYRPAAVASLMRKLLSASQRGRSRDGRD